jgi:hypothetical protein
MYLTILRITFIILVWVYPHPIHPNEVFMTLMQDYALTYKHEMYKELTKLSFSQKMEILIKSISKNTSLRFTLDASSSWSARVQFHGMVKDEEIIAIRKALNCEHWNDWQCEGGWTERLPTFNFHYDFTRIFAK